MNLTKKYVLGITLISVLAITCTTIKNSTRPNVKNYILKDSAGKVVVNPNPTPAFFNQQESLSNFVLQEGYQLELVASEPMVSEPVAIVWDGNGAMYVAEFNTYMQDVDGTGESNRTCRIKRLEDTNNDGVMDKVTVFIDSLVLPRMMLPLDGALLVNETYSNNIFSYRDTKGTGRADEKKLVFSNPLPNTSNLEHQKSGLIWNLDNRIYTTVENTRYTYKNGLLVPEKLREGPGGQWGLANDDYGRLFFSAAGAEIPALNFQQNPYYGRFDFKDQYNAEFQEVWPIIATPDVQGGLRRLKPDSTLNHFTGCNGQSIYRGDKLPADLRGDYILCEPVGRLIRRAKVINTDGKITMKNAYEKEEFIASADMNFRPVNTANGPDGCLYIVDMNRGIIQEGTWTREGSYLRKQILNKGLQKNIGRGRIYRLVYKGIAPSKERPHMLNEPASKLVQYLAHPNGWWRDNAQKLIVLRGDLSVVPALKQMASQSKNTLARIHALWTLDGLKSLDNAVLSNGFKDPDAQVRKTAIWISESRLGNDPAIMDQLKFLANDASADVRFQLALSLRFDRSAKAQAILQEMIDKYPGNEMLIASQKKYKDNIIAKEEQAKAEKLLNAEAKRLVSNGAVIFRNLCSTCHGIDARGLSIGGKDMPAPPLAGSKDVNGEPEKLIKILLHGLSGPVDGKTYPDVMPALGGNDDDYIASVLSYIRNDFGNKANVITAVEVKRVRDKTKGRTQSWTMAELNAPR